ncbi:MAG: thermonuclease family protein [Sulfitobacter sp.]
MLKFLIRLFSSKPKTHTRSDVHRSATIKPSISANGYTSQRHVRRTQTVVETTVVKLEREPAQHAVVTGKCFVNDGDTIQIGKVRLRLAGIDAPEMEHPWGKKAKWELVKLYKGQIITAELEPEISYDRVVATCYLPDGRDLSAEMVKIGLAIDWPSLRVESTLRLSLKA